ncbi:MAG TPA: HepT-like ribonuclease domain-containing protein [Thermoanaerobaculia bacterium]|nr:HepT-like ribonuclease domain-containing protein [Thermoanaerobaculia bacterium]
MTRLPERLAELRRHLDHLRELRPRVTGAEVLRRDLSLHNDVLFSLLTISQLVIDLAGELSARRGLRFEDYTEAVRNLASFPEFPTPLVRELERLPGFRNVLIHEYVSLDYQRVVEILNSLQPIEVFAEAVRRIEEGRADQDG